MSLFAERENNTLPPAIAPLASSRLGADRSRWRRVTLGDVADDVSARVDNPSASSVERFVGLEHLDSGSLTIKRWGSTADLISAMKVFQAGDVLFARRNVYLRRASKVTFEGLCSGDAFVIRHRAGAIEPDFLPLILNTDALWAYATANAEGTFSRRVKWRELAKFEFTLPPLDEQRRIADVLWAVEDALSIWKNAFASITATEQVIADFLLDTEKKWERHMIGKMGQVILGRQRAPNFMTGKHSKPYIRVANVYDGRFALNDILEMDFDARHFQKYRLCKNDVLLVEGNQSPQEVGRAAIWQEQISDCCFQNTLINYRCNQALLPYYAWSYFRVARRAGVFAEASKSTTIAHLGAERFANLTIPVPPLDVQAQLVNTLQQIGDSQTQLAAQTDRLKAIKSGLSRALLG